MSTLQRASRSRLAMLDFSSPLRNVATPSRPFDFVQKTYLIVGASTGIGLEFVKQLLAQGHIVLATARSPFSSSLSSARNLFHLTGKENGENLNVVEVDIEDEMNIWDFKQSIRAMSVGGKILDKGIIDTVIINAGRLIHPGRISDIPYKEFETQMRTNCVGPLSTAQSILSLSNPPLAQNGQRQIHIRTLVFISAEAGSAFNFNPEDDTFGAFAASKAALNQGLRHLAAELWSGKSQFCYEKSLEITDTADEENDDTDFHDDNDVNNENDENDENKENIPPPPPLKGKGKFVKPNIRIEDKDDVLLYKVRPAPPTLTSPYAAIAATSGSSFPFPYDTALYPFANAQQIPGSSSTFALDPSPFANIPLLPTPAETPALQVSPPSTIAGIKRTPPIVLALHPGNVATDERVANHRGLWGSGVISVEESVEGMLKVIESKGADGKQEGGKGTAGAIIEGVMTDSVEGEATFWTWQGKPCTW